MKLEAASLLEPVERNRDSLIEEWRPRRRNSARLSRGARLFCIKEKAIYATLNLFEGNMNLRASCWYPLEDEDRIRALCIQSGGAHGHGGAMLVPDKLAPRKQPPTYIRT